MIFQELRAVSGGFGLFSGEFRRVSSFGLFSDCSQASSDEFRASLQAVFSYIADNQQSTSESPTDSSAPAKEKLNQSPPEGTLRQVTFLGPNRVCSQRCTELSENELIDAESTYGLAGISGVFGTSLQAEFSYIAENQ